MSGRDQLHEVLSAHGVHDFREALRDEEGVHDICDLYNAFDSNDEAESWARDHSMPGRCDEYGKSMVSAWQAAGKTAKRQRKEWSRATQVLPDPAPVRRVVWALWNDRANPGGALCTEATLARQKKATRMQSSLMQCNGMLAGTAVTEQQEEHKAAQITAQLTTEMCLEFRTTWRQKWKALSESSRPDFFKLRLEEFAVFQAGGQRARMATLRDLQAYMRDKKLCLVDEEYDEAETGVAVDMYVRACAGGRRGKGGYTAGMTVSKQLIWWRQHAKLLIPELGKLPHSAAPRAIALKIGPKQAHELSIALVIHAEQWTATEVTGARFLSCFQSHLTLAVLRFRHGQRYAYDTVRELCIIGAIYRDKARNSAGVRDARTVITPRYGVTGADVGLRYTELLDSYNLQRDAPADFGLPCISRRDGQFVIGTSAMSYAQYREATAAWYQQSPANLPAAVAQKLSGHSPRRWATTMCGIRRVDEGVANAVAGWAGKGKNAVTSMPIRYHGSRDLTELGCKMENIQAAASCVAAAKPGEALHWGRVAELLQDIPDVEKMVASQLAKHADPASRDKALPIFNIPDTMSSPEKTAKEKLEEANEDSADSDADGAASDNSDSSSGSSASDAGDARREEQQAPPMDESDEEMKAAKALGTSPEKTEAVPAEFASAMELEEHLANKACVSHDERSTIHVLAKSGMTACRRNPAEWAQMKFIEHSQVINEFLPLCADRRCFGTLCKVSERLKLSRRRSGR